jgi:hypothetical protein
MVASRPDVLLLAINFDENKAVVKALGVKVRCCLPLFVLPSVRLQIPLPPRVCTGVKVVLEHGVCNSCCSAPLASRSRRRY